MSIGLALGKARHRIARTDAPRATVLPPDGLKCHQCRLVSGFAWVEEQDRRVDLKCVRQGAQRGQAGGTLAPLNERELAVTDLVIRVSHEVGLAPAPGLAQLAHPPAHQRRQVMWPSSQCGQASRRT